MAPEAQLLGYLIIDGPVHLKILLGQLKQRLRAVSMKARRPTNTAME